MDSLNLRENTPILYQKNKHRNPHFSMPKRSLKSRKCYLDAPKVKPPFKPPFKILIHLEPFRQLLEVIGLHIVVHVLAIDTSTY